MEDLVPIIRRYFAEGASMYCPLCGLVTLDDIKEGGYIHCIVTTGGGSKGRLVFDRYGRILNERILELSGEVFISPECLIFPGVDVDWEAYITTFHESITTFLTPDSGTTTIFEEIANKLDEISVLLRKVTRY